jgi:tetratricopeptide (TPR) repeat protein
LIWIIGFSLRSEAVFVDAFDIAAPFAVIAVEQDLRRHFPAGDDLVERFEEAFNLLVPMLKRFPHDEAIPYNLACYKYQNGEFQEAREWLERALKVGDSKRVKHMAIADPDLTPLWEQGVKIK